LESVAHSGLECCKLASQKCVAHRVMARRKVNFYEGSYYHIYNRGANRESIFRSNENYLFLLRRLGEALSGKSIAVIAYCLMPIIIISYYGKMERL